MPTLVMHGLDPCIQGRRPRIITEGAADARLEAGHDERRRKPPDSVISRRRLNETLERASYSILSVITLGPADCDSIRSPDVNLGGSARSAHKIRVRIFG